MITRLGLAKSAAKLVPRHSAVVAITGATLGVVSRLAGDMAINQSVVGVSVPTNRALNDYLYFWLRSHIDELTRSATGAAQQHVNKSDVEELKVAIPDPDAVLRVGESSLLLDYLDVLAAQTISLGQGMEGLLPELLSGRVRVAEAEPVYEAAM